MTAEELKAMVRLYAGSQHTRWVNAAVVIRVGGPDEVETLLILPTSDPASPPTPPPPASPGGSESPPPR